LGGGVGLLARPTMTVHPQEEYTTVEMLCLAQTFSAWPANNMLRTVSQCAPTLGLLQGAKAVANETG
jgi:hypothetical protein